MPAGKGWWRINVINQAKTGGAYDSPRKINISYFMFAIEIIYFHWTSAHHGEKTCPENPTLR